jgi:hypothetical protein
LIFAASCRSGLHDPVYADAFTRMNADLNVAWLGPARKRRERRNFWIVALICAALALLG